MSDSEEDINITGGIPAIIAAARAQKGAEVVDIFEALALPGDYPVAGVPMLVLPREDGAAHAESVLPEVLKWRDAFATQPVRRKGTARLEEIDPFIAHALRFKDADSAIFVAGGARMPSFMAVYDYHHAGGIATAEPRFGEHRAVYTPAFSDEWKAWVGAHNKGGHTQAEFCALIQNRARDIFDVGPGRTLAESPTWFAARFGRDIPPETFYADSARLLDLSEGLTVTVQDRVGDVVRQGTGEQRITFESERKTDIDIPVAFVIEVPVFVGGDHYQIPVRLRFRVKPDGDTKRAEWRVEMFGADATVLAVVGEMRETIAGKTGLPIFAGAPE